MEDRIVAELNAELGSKVEDLCKSRDLRDSYVKQLNVIEEKVGTIPFVYFVHILQLFFCCSSHSLVIMPRKS